jgi:hypothetical protein
MRPPQFPPENTELFRPGFRVFANYDLPPQGIGGKEVQPGPIRAPVQPGKRRGFQEGDIPAAKVGTDAGGFFRFYNLFQSFARLYMNGEKSFPVHSEVLPDRAIENTVFCFFFHFPEE